MAVHSGEAQSHRGDYRTPAVYRAYRLAALARGGQVLLSQSAKELLAGSMPEDVGLRELGDYRLRDMAQPEHVFQLVAPDLEDFGTLDRVLLTILFTDIVGSTATAVQMGDRSWRTLIASHHALLREYLPRFRGREIRSTGDEICAMFNTPTQAIECARVMCIGVRNLGLQIRAGIHTGECEIASDTVEGLAVHIAARVGDCAGAGQVLVTRTVADLVAGSGTNFTDLGTRVFRGAPGEWQLLQVTG
jgi:class 3 adenylate cyclase